MKDFKTSVLSTESPVAIFGHTFNGLSDIRDHIEAMSTIGHSHERGVWDKPYITSRTPEKYAPGCHVLEIYERYPCFD